MEKAQVSVETTDVTSKNELCSSSDANPTTDYNGRVELMDQLIQKLNLAEKSCSSDYNDSKGKSNSDLRFEQYTSEQQLAAFSTSNILVGTIVCKLDDHRGKRRGYIAMLAVEDGYRRRGIGSALVEHAVGAMAENGCDEVVLETEVTNKVAMALYERLGFVADRRLFRYYLNGHDAFRLKLWLS